MMVGPGDEIAAVAADRHGRLRASHTDREQVIDALKAAFVQGRLTKDELDLRVSQALASRTYADLDALTTDIPATPTAAQPPKPAREPNQPNNKKLAGRVSVARCVGAGMIIGAVAVPQDPVTGLVAGAMLGSFVAVLLAGLLTFLSWVLGKGSDRHRSY